MELDDVRCHWVTLGGIGWGWLALNGLFGIGCHWMALDGILGIKHRNGAGEDSIRQSGLSKR